MGLDNGVNIGTEAGSVSTNAMLGELAFMDADNLILELTSTVSPLNAPNTASFYAVALTGAVGVGYTDASGNVRIGVIPTTAGGGNSALVPITRSVKNLEVYNDNNVLDASGNVNGNIITVKFSDITLVNNANSQAIRMYGGGGTLSVTIDASIIGKGGTSAALTDPGYPGYYVWVGADYATNALYGILAPDNIVPPTGTGNIGTYDSYMCVGYVPASGLYLLPMHQKGTEVKLPFFKNTTRTFKGVLNTNAANYNPNTTANIGTIDSSGNITLAQCDFGTLIPKNARKVKFKVISGSGGNIALNGNNVTDGATSNSVMPPDICILSGDATRVKTCEVLLEDNKYVYIAKDSVVANIYVIGYEIDI